MSLKYLLAAALIASPGAVFAQETPSPEGATVYIVNLEDGDTVQSPVTVIFGLSGMGVAPSGVERENTGHHHLLLNRAPFGDLEQDAETSDFGIPGDDNHIHFGGGQTQVTLDLPPGEHTLQMVLGDLDHIPHVPAVMSSVITITVE